MASDHPKWVKVLGRIGLILVVVGVVAESRYGGKLEDAHNDIHTHDMALLTATQLNANDAATSAKTAHQELDAVETEAATITDRLNKASTQLTVLENRIAQQGPRWRILEDKRVAFIEALKPFAGQRVTVVRCEQISPLEQERLEGSLIKYLGKEGAGWEVGYSVWANCHNWAASIPGNVVFYNSTASEAVKSSANALAGILNKLKISTLTIHPPPGSGRLWEPDSPWALAANDPTIVFLLIGANPMTDLPGLSRPDLPGMNRPHK